MLMIGCDYGWIEFKGHCYFNGQQQATWPEAKVKLRITVILLVSYIISFVSKLICYLLLLVGMSKEVFVPGRDWR